MVLIGRKRMPFKLGFKLFELKSALKLKTKTLQLLTGLLQLSVHQSKCNTILFFFFETQMKEPFVVVF